MNIRSTIPAVGLFGAIVALTWAQEGAKPAETPAAAATPGGTTAGLVAGQAIADPYRLFAVADALMAANRSVQFEARAEGVGALGGTIPTVVARVAMDRDEPGWFGQGGVWRVSVRGRLSDPAEASGEAALRERPFEFYRMVDEDVLILPDRKEMLSVSNLALPTAMDLGPGYVVGWIQEWRRLVVLPMLEQQGRAADRTEAGKAGAKGASADQPRPKPGSSLALSLDGVRQIDGVTCDVIKAETTLADGSAYTTWWSIARTDRFPRRLEVRVFSERGEGFAVLSLGRVQVNTPLESGAYSWSLPADWRVGELEPKQK
ncbi:MAG: hypothetical protein ACK5Z4_13935 [Planctomyces sp.]